MTLITPSNLRDVVIKCSGGGLAPTRAEILVSVEKTLGARFSCRLGGKRVVPCPEDSHGGDVCQIGDDFRQVGAAVISEQGGEQLTDERAFRDDVVQVPNVFDDGGNPTDLDEFMDAMSEETGGE